MPLFTAEQLLQNQEREQKAQRAQETATLDQNEIDTRRVEADLAAQRPEGTPPGELGGLEASVTEASQKLEQSPFADGKISFGETFRAFGESENPVFNAAKAAIDKFAESGKVDPNFDASATLLEENPELQGAEDRFSRIGNREDYDRVVANITRELENKRVLREAPITSVLAAGLLNAVGDPTSYIPLGGFAKASRLANVGKGIFVGAGAGAAASTIRESILTLTQETRLPEETRNNIISETVIGGILGGAIGGISKPTAMTARRLLANDLNEIEPKIRLDEKGKFERVDLGDRSASASERASELDDLGLARINERAVRIVSGPDALKPPDLRAVLSPSESVRKLGEVFYNSNFIRRKHASGLSSGPRAQNAIFRRDSKAQLRTDEVHKLYTDYSGKSLLRSQFALDEGKIPLKKFSTRIWRNLTDETRVDKIPQVNRAAKLIRKDMDDTLKELQAEGILGDIEPEFARNYMNRVYDLDKLATLKDQDNFVSKVKDWMITNNKDGSVRATPLDEDTAEAAAQKALDKILGETDQQIALNGISENIISKGKFLKGRQLLIPDEQIQEFLVDDALRLYSSYTAKSGRLLETHKALKRAGFDSLEDVKRQIRSELNRAKAGKNADEAKKLNKQYSNASDTADMMFRSMLGKLKTPGKLDNAANYLLHYQFLRLLGGVTISSFPEMAMPIFRFGFTKAFNHGFLPMMKSIETSKLAKNQLNALTGAFDLEMGGLLKSIGNLDDFSKGKVERVLEGASTGFAKASFIQQWTNMGRRISAHVSTADIVTTLQKGPKGKEIERLASIGIGKDDYAPLLAEIKTNVTNTKGSYFLNPEKWKNKELLEKIESAIQVDVESTILKPGVESLPLFAQQHQWAKVMFQFKSFMSGATSKILISGMQRRDADVLMGLVTLVALGALADVTKRQISGARQETDIDQLITNGVSRSGFMGLLGTSVFDVSNTFLDPKSKRFTGKFVQSQIFGPSASTILDITDTFARLTDGDVTSKDAKAASRLIPFANLFYLQTLITQATEVEE